MANSLSKGLIIGISVGVTIGLVIGGCILICYYRVRVRKRPKQIQESSSDWRGMQLPIRVNGLDATSVLSDVTIGANSPPQEKENNGTFRAWFGGGEKTSNSILSHSGLPNFPYK